MKCPKHVSLSREWKRNRWKTSFSSFPRYNIPQSGCTAARFSRPFSGPQSTVPTLNEKVTSLEHRNPGDEGAAARPKPQQVGARRACAACFLLSPINANLKKPTRGHLAVRRGRGAVFLRGLLDCFITKGCPAVAKLH